MRTLYTIIALSLCAASFAQETVPYATSFEGVEGNLNENFPAGWTAEDLNTAGLGNQGWQIIKNSNTQQNAHTDSTAVHMFDNANEANNDWLYTPGFQVQMGVAYSLSFWYSRAAGFPSTEKLALHAGATAASSAMGPALWQNTNITNGAYQQAVVSWTAPSTSVYHFGFRSFSAAFEFILLMDDFAIDGSSGIGEIPATELNAWMIGDDLVILPKADAIGANAHVVDAAGASVARFRITSLREVHSMASCAEGLYTVVLEGAQAQGARSKRVAIVR